MMAVPGVWLRWLNGHGNTSDWHWQHANDPTTYCGFRPRQVVEREQTWEPVRICQKCGRRILREGY